MYIQLVNCIEGCSDVIRNALMSSCADKYGNIREVAAMLDYISIGASMGLFGFTQMFLYCTKYMLDRAKSYSSAKLKGAKYCI